MWLLQKVHQVKNWMLIFFILFDFRIIVKMDDNIVRHYSHESTFIIEMNKIGDSQDFEIILTEIEAVPSCWWDICELQMKVLLLAIWRSAYGTGGDAYGGSV